MIYVALLRGINVGGKNSIKMSELKICFENAGFENVVTIINSGNVIFTADQKEDVLVGLTESAIKGVFGLEIKVVIVSKKNIIEIVKNVPLSWKTKSNIRCNIAFLRKNSSVDTIMESVRINETVDYLDRGPGVVYMTTLLSGLTKSYFNKMVGTKIYKEITIRNYNTTRKILEIMEK